VKEPALSYVHSAEEQPVSLVPGPEDPVSGSLRKSFQAFVELSGPEDRQHHSLVEVGTRPVNAGLLPDKRSGAVTTHHVLRLEDLHLGAAGLSADDDAYTIVILVNGLRGPAEQARDAGEFPCPGPEHSLHQVLRQPLVPLKVIGLDDLASFLQIPVLAHQVAVGGHSADGIARGE
jgi:hypothetical protein